MTRNACTRLRQSLTERDGVSEAVGKAFDRDSSRMTC